MKKSKMRDHGSDDGEYRYRPRKQADWQGRQEQSGGSWDPQVKDGIRQFKSKDGENRIRVLPPGWDNARSFAFEVFRHDRVGPDKGSYLCPEKAGKGPCPICDERRKIEPTVREGDKEMKDYVFRLNPVKRTAFFLVDRNKESEGPVLWIAPWKCERDMVAAAKDPDTREYFAVDDPDNGCDVFFNRSGSQDRTEYTNWKLSKAVGPLHQDPAVAKPWLRFILANKIPDILIFHSYEKILKAFKGKSVKDDDGTDKKKDGGPPRDDTPAKSKKYEDPRGDDDWPESDPDAEPIKKKKKLKKGKIKKLKKKKKKKLRRDEDE